MIEQILLYLLKALGFIAAFGLAVFVHELGHFLAAKLFRVPVERFVIGFDKEAMPFMPRCIVEKEWGGTTYGLSLVPLGGYVKMSGVVHPDIEKYLDGEDAAPPAEPKREGLVEQAMGDQAALYQRPFQQKVIIYGAGVVMNFLLAMAVVAFLNAKGTKVDAPLPAVVAWQAPESYNTELGLLPGDRVVTVDGKAIATDNEFYQAVDALFPAERKGDALAAFVLEAALVVERGGAPVEVAARYDWGEEPQRSAFARLLSRPAHIEYVMRNLPAHRAGMHAGDTIVSVDGEPIDDWFEFTHIVRASLGKDLEVVVRDRDGKERALEMKPVESTEEKGIGLVGVQPGNPEKVHERVPVLTAMAASPGLVVSNIQRYVSHLGKIGKRLIRGDVQAVRRDLGGPVAIAQMAGYHTALGLDRWLEFLIMLNIALGVMNLLPFPVLDGGHIVFALYEGLFGKPMAPKILVPVLHGGVVVLIGFFVLITFSDVLKIFGL